MSDYNSNDCLPRVLIGVVPTDSIDDVTLGAARAHACWEAVR